MRAVPQTAILGEREAGKIRDSIERVKAGLQQTLHFNLLLAGRNVVRCRRGLHELVGCHGFLLAVALLNSGYVALVT